MQLRIFYIALLLFLIAIGIYSFTQNKPAADADNNKKPYLAATEPSVKETAAIDSRRILAEGQFHNVAHTGAGTATIYKDEKGRHFLHFTEFETTPATDLQVCLQVSADPKDRASIHSVNSLIVAPLKAIMGNQTYELPANIHVTKYQAVTIVSRSKNADFAMAPLTRQPK
jgi:hypothetical protein